MNVNTDESSTHITMEGLNTTLRSLPNHKAPGSNKIKYEDLKHLSLLILNNLLTLFNTCLHYGIIPD